MMAELFGLRSAPAKFGRVSEGDGASSLPDPRVGRRIGAHDFGRLPLRGQVCGPEDAHVIIAGRRRPADDIDKQSARLNSDVSQSVFHRVPLNRPHDPSNGDARRDGGQRSSCGRRRQARLDVSGLAGIVGIEQCYGRVVETPLTWRGPVRSDMVSAGRPASGSRLVTGTRPDVATIFDRRPAVPDKWASFRPSIEPGI